MHFNKNTFTTALAVTFAFAAGLLPACAFQQIQTDSVAITVSEGTNIALTVSPDQKEIAFDLQGTLWLLPAAGGKARPLTDALGDVRQPAWSPDGERIAFQSYRDGTYHIWSINRDGTGLRQLTFGVFDDREPFWSPDGQHIVFSSDRRGNYDVWQLELASGKLIQLTTDAANDYYPAFSADGRIAYYSERKIAPGIYVLDGKGGDKILVHGKDKLSAPSWDPTGQYIAFHSQAEGSARLDLVKAEGGDWKTLSAEGEDVFPFRVSWLSPQTYLYTADGQIKKGSIGKAVAQSIPFTASFKAGRHRYAAKKRDFDSEVPRQVRGIRNPVISPDGKHFAFTALGDLYLLSQGNAKPKAITNDRFIEIDPAFSPDGRLLAYASDKNGNSDLWIRELQTGQDKLLVNAPGPIKYPSWSNDGSKIAYYELDPKGWLRYSLKILDLKTGTSEMLYAPLFDSSLPSWSPDGQFIIVSALQPYSSRYREGVSEFLLIDTRDKSSRFIAPVEEQNPASRGKNGPLWSPDGSKLAYGLNGTLWTVEIDPREGKLLGPPRQVTSVLSESFSWTGDSQQVAFLSSGELKKVRLSTGKVEAVALDFTWKQQKPAGRYSIHAGRLFDGKTGSYRSNVDILINQNRITGVEPHRAGRGGKVIDASGKTVIPGLFEMHTHQSALAGEELGRLWLAYGITSTREPGTEPYDVIERKEAWQSGRRVGPRTFYAGALMDGNRVYYGLAVSNTAGAQLDQELDRAKKLDYDMIKTYVRMSDLVQQRVVGFAHANGIPVSSHEIYPAAGYGVDAVEHIGATSRRGYSPKLSLSNRSYGDVVQIIAKSGLNITPTASLHGGLHSLAARDAAFFDNRQFKSFYSQQAIADIREAGALRQKTNPGFLSSFNHIQKTLGAIIREGGRVTPGTDSPIIPPGVSLHAELQSWTDGGITPLEALRAATLWSAEAVDVGKDLGSIEAGKLADLLIIDGDPLADVKDVLKVETVVKNGIAFPVSDLLNQPK